MFKCIRTHSVCHALWSHPAHHVIRFMSSCWPDMFNQWINNSKFWNEGFSSLKKQIEWKVKSLFTPQCQSTVMWHVESLLDLWKQTGVAALIKSNVCLHKPQDLKFIWKDVFFIKAAAGNFSNYQENNFLNVMWNISNDKTAHSWT